MPISPPSSQPNISDNQDGLSEPASANQLDSLKPNTDGSSPGANVDLKPESQKPPQPTATMGQKNALKKSRDYLSFTAFSYSGLISQLEFEGFSTDESTYAVENCGADWNEQAAKKAKSYLEFTSFSRSGLIEQLKFEGFTSSQAEYGASAVGY